MISIFRLVWSCLHRRKSVIETSAPQIQNSWYTALHIAISKQLVNTTKMLIHHGADVNAVAINDEMPLNAADKLETSRAKDEIIHTLESKFALRSYAFRFLYAFVVELSVLGGKRM